MQRAIPFRHQRLLVAGLLLLAGLIAQAQSAPLISGVDAVDMTVSDMDRAISFYSGVLTFKTISDREVAGETCESLEGVFGVRMRVVRMQLGDEFIELTEYLAPKGRLIPITARSNDRSFQHIAIVVSDMARAYSRLRERGVEHASTGPQRLPDWNRGAAGISAFYFRDPDRHFLEIISFPNDKGTAKWHGAHTDLFLGIDHTAIVVDDTNVSLRLYRDTLGLKVAGESENYDIEQEHLNNVFGARLRITALRAGKGPGIELLEYLAPRDGRPSPADLRANDIAHWQTTLVAQGLDSLVNLARDHRLSLISPGAVDTATSVLGFRTGSLTRDPDGHGLRFVAP